MKQKIKDEILKEILPFGFGETNMFSGHFVKDWIEEAIELTQQKTLKEFLEKLNHILEECRINMNSITYIEVKELRNKIKKELEK